MSPSTTSASSSRWHLPRVAGLEKLLLGQAIAGRGGSGALLVAPARPLAMDPAQGCSWAFGEDEDYSSDPDRGSFHSLKSLNAQNLRLNQPIVFSPASKRSRKLGRARLRLVCSIQWQTFIRRDGASQRLSICLPSDRSVQGRILYTHVRSGARWGRLSRSHRSRERRRRRHWLEQQQQSNQL